MHLIDMFAPTYNVVIAIQCPEVYFCLVGTRVLCILYGRLSTREFYISVILSRADIKMRKDFKTAVL